MRLWGSYPYGVCQKGWSHLFGKALLLLESQKGDAEGRGLGSREESLQQRLL